MTDDTSHTTLRGVLVQRGYAYREFSLGQMQLSEFTAPNGWRWMVPRSNYIYPFIPRMAQKISRNKLLSYEFVHSLGVQTPATIQTADSEQAQQFLVRYKSLVVKPLAESGSRGLTTDISSESELSEALARAGEYHHTPLIQQQFFGDELRLTVLEGKVRSVILRQSPRVCGDGVHTTAQLIAQENDARARLHFPHLTYPQLDSLLIPEKYLKSNDIPEVGQIIELSKTTLVRQGASLYEVLEDTHKTYSELAERLAAHISPSMLIVDIMVKDYKQPLRSDNYIFLEFNTTPALKVYTSLRAGGDTSIFTILADMIDEYSRLYRSK